MLIAYGFRVNLSVAIVAMTDTTPNNNTDIPVSIFKNTQKGDYYISLADLSTLDSERCHLVCVFLGLHLAPNSGRLRGKSFWRQMVSGRYHGHSKQHRLLHSIFS